jgi:hypothetical protein
MVGRVVMDTDHRPHHEQIALTMLRRYGLAAVWRLQLTAARVYRQGHKAAALYIAEIADAAEREWMKRQAADFRR